MVDTPERALQALNVLYDYAELQKSPLIPLPSERIPDPLLKSCPEGILGASKARRLLASYGIELIEDYYPDSFDDAEKLAEEMGYPLVLKGEVEGIAHKTEAGLVKTGINTADQLRASMKTMAISIAGRGCYVMQRQIENGIEILLGARIDAAVGSMAALSFGGIFVEVMGKPQTEFAPFDPDIAQAMIDRMDPRSVLSGYRGRPCFDVNKLAQLISRFSELIYHNRDYLREIDLNPVIVNEDGVFVVDVMIAVG